MNSWILLLNRAAPIVLDALWHASLVGAALIALLLLVRGVLGDRLSPTVRGTLWTLVLVRLLFPFSPVFALSANPLPSPTAMAHAVVSASSGQPGDGPVSDAGGDRREAAVSAPRPAELSGTPAPLSGLALVMLIYVIGVVINGVLLLLGVARAARLVRRAAQIADAASVGLLESAKQDLGVSGPVMLAQSPDCPTPVVVGTLRPVILLPEGLAESLSAGEMRDLLLHELAHIKRRDILLAWLWSLARVLHWFNPLVYVAAWCVRIDREPACDRLALSHLGPGSPAAYGRTLLKLVAALRSASPATMHTRRVVPAHAAIVEAFADESLAFKGRIRMIAAFRPIRPRPFASAMLALLVGAIALFTFTRSPAGAQPPIAEFNHFSYNFTGYTADENAMVNTGPGARMEVLARDDSSLVKPAKADPKDLDRVTLVIVDAEKRPLVARLLDRDALRLRADLAQAIASRTADLANAALKAQLAPEPAGPEFSMSQDRLTVRFAPGPDGLSPFTIGRVYAHPTADGQPHLPIEITFETVISGGTMAWVARARLPIANAKQLQTDLESALTLRKVTLPALKAPIAAKAIREKARTDLKYAFNLGGGLAAHDRWVVTSGQTLARIVTDDGALRLQFLDPTRRDMADEPVVDFVLTKAQAKTLFTDLLEHAQSPFDLQAWAKGVSPKLNKTPDEIVKSVQNDEAAREGTIKLNINRESLQFVANRPPYAPDDQILTAHPRGALDVTRVCLMLSPKASATTSQNCTMIAYMTLDAARELAAAGLKAAE